MIPSSNCALFEHVEIVIAYYFIENIGFAYVHDVDMSISFLESLALILRRSINKCEVSIENRWKFINQAVENNLQV